MLLAGRPCIITFPSLSLIILRPSFLLTARRPRKPRVLLPIRTRLSRLALISGRELSAALTEGQRLLHHHPSRKEARPPQKPGADGMAQQGCCRNKC